MNVHLPQLNEVSREALATATGVVTAVYVVLFMGLEDPYWAALSAIIIANLDHGASFTKGVLRVAGTLVGVVVGYYVSQWTEGMPLQQGALVALAAGAGTYGRMRSPHGYAWFYGAITFLIVMLTTMIQPQELFSFAHFRFYEISVGVICGTLSSWALTYRRGEHRLRIAPQIVAAAPATALRQSIIAAMGAIAIVLTWVWFDLPQLPQVLISSLIVLDIDPLATRHRGTQRIIGCVIGGAAGLAVMIGSATNEVWWVTMLFAGTFLFARVHLSKSANAYVGTQSAIAYVVTLVSSGPPQTLYPPLDRLVGIIIGVTIIMTLVWAFRKRVQPRSDGEAVTRITPENAAAG
jgi:uncharacterized membrane protein YccC